jgi:hypothetical protein
VDLELGTLPDGLRTALVVGIGPRPEGMNPVPEFTIFT